MAHIDAVRMRPHAAAPLRGVAGPVCRALAFVLDRTRSFGAAAALVCAAAGFAAPAIAASQLAHEPLRLAAVLDDGRAIELEAYLVKPALPARLPLAVLTHGSPRDAAGRARMAATQMAFQAEELARRGYLAVVVMRRGYGTSSSGWSEGYGRCDSPEYERAARESARDLRAALHVLATRPDVDRSRMIVIGQSAGGIAAVALAAQPPEGLKAIVNFAGGRGSRGPNDVCSEDRLVDAYGALGKTARIPSLWIYTENDLYFRPALAQRMFDAYRTQGGSGELRLLPAFGTDGHALFHRLQGVAHWQPLLDAFLAKNALPTWDGPPAETAAAR